MYILNHQFLLKKKFLEALSLSPSHPWETLPMQVIVSHSLTAKVKEYSK